MRVNFEFNTFPLPINFFFSAEVMTSFGYQCRTTEESNRMWECCKTSIGKRCQNLRKGEKQRVD